MKSLKKKYFETTFVFDSLKKIFKTNLLNDLNSFRPNKSHFYFESCITAMNFPMAKIITGKKKFFLVKAAMERSLKSKTKKMDSSTP